MLGIVVKNGQVKVRGQALQRRAGARRTAGVQQQLRAGTVQRAQDLFHFKLMLMRLGMGSDLVYTVAGVRRLRRTKAPQPMTPTG